MHHPSTAAADGDRDTGHEVLAAVLRIREDRLQVLLWQRAQTPDLHSWALPGGRLGAAEDVETSVTRQLSEKVDVHKLSHVEQLSVFSDPHRVPAQRLVATAFLGLVPCDVDPELPADTRWHPVDGLPTTAFDHEAIVLTARDRLRAKLSYSNIGFALAPPEFTVSKLRRLYSAALGYRVAATNLQRVLSRRGVLEAAGRTVAAGPNGGRPPALFRFTSRDLRITDPFAVLRPPHQA
ncbi:8-oxo-dGTP diphosphatase [Saccharopolyspora lacisalsi]|uniref:8-oxo-dGTP diphosphatase n=1 Tax=Halosaccharopolyspora lacisalsi TaxID=1000566 RepID=A0A839DWA6_9PSEU|nr:NUDIX domain-containing protein [Halosaccharopolyspora lacisalsi]MBA8823471.1 8-oxo-dGTP diphosphatase [Halosaccharopolyspora lacisalsi]